nr:YolD-like family protein [Campylobacter concisus]
MRQKEREKCEKLELDESKVDEILKTVSELKIADEVRVIYHDGFTYIKTSGLVSDVNFKDKILMIVKTKIKFEDINRIEIVKKFVV